MKRGILFAIVLGLVSTMSFAQTGKYGIGIDGVTSPNIIGAYYFTPSLSGELILGLNVYSPGGDAAPNQTKVTGTDFRIGAACLYHFGQSDLRPYIGVDAIYETVKSGGFYVTEPDAKNSLQANVILGAEYYLAKQFSIGVKEKIGINAQFSRDVPKEENDLYVNTSSVITARFYF
ncbi:MAG: outer membrane beta-barrel protein [Ignavibacteria bacterium]|nr:outer membrane beta-barrel protein [Ignavibacteria bacterium]